MVRVGGPIWIPKVVHGKNKLFFFLDYMATKRRLYSSDYELDAPTRPCAPGFSATPAKIYDRSPATRMAPAARSPQQYDSGQPHRYGIRHL